MLVALLLSAQLTAATASSRPVDCSLASGPRANVWERVKHPELGRACDLLAAAAARLAPGSERPEEAIRLAMQAEQRMPGRGAPLALRGRAEAMLGRDADAFATFGAARAAEPSSVDEPATLYALARSAARSGHKDVARDAYLALMPRSSVLTSDQRAAALLEAGLLVLSAGPARLADAIAILRQARVEARDARGAAATFALALALDRAGAREEARAVAAESSVAVRAVMADARVRDALSVQPEEVDALAAIASGGDDKVALERWRTYLAQAPSGPWAPHARSRAEELAARSPRRR